MAKGRKKQEEEKEQVQEIVQKFPQKETIQIKIEDNKEYKFKSNGKSKHLNSNEIYKISGHTAKMFIRLGYGDIID